MKKHISNCMRSNIQELHLFFGPSHFSLSPKVKIIQVIIASSEDKSEYSKHTDVVSEANVSLSCIVKPALDLWSVCFINNL